MKALITAVCFFFSGIIFSQQTRIIRGVVNDSSTGDPVVGAIISTMDTLCGTSTDLSGLFQLECPFPGPDSIYVLSLGYDPLAVAVSDTMTILLNSTLMLKTSVTALYCVSISDQTMRKRHFRSNVRKSRARFSSFSMTTENSERYASVEENTFNRTINEPLSTLSIDVDRASYSNVRRMINGGNSPEADAVRVEEMINYFIYEYPQPTGEHPIGVYTETGPCPWNPDHQLLMVGMQGKSIPTADLPSGNFVFLLDVSGSMDADNKLPLVISSMKLLLNQLRPQDRVAIVVYAGASGVVLESTPASEKARIEQALESLSAGGSTAGGEGIELAYKIAADHFVPGGNNRVILCTDGDFNVGVESPSELKKLVEQKRETGIYLTCLGFGTGNIKDDNLETLADKGNGNYAYIDNLMEAHKTLVTEFGGSMFTIAGDVKAQIEFNPAQVDGYRLIGYENRLLEDEEFRDDKVDAGELGSGYQVTMLFELIPAGVKSPFLPDSLDLKYQSRGALAAADQSGEIATVKIRYKQPGQRSAIEFSEVVPDTISGGSANLNFSASVAMFGMLLRDSAFKQGSSYDQVLTLAGQTLSYDPNGYRAEFIRLAQLAQQLSGQ